MQNCDVDAVDMWLTLLYDIKINVIYHIRGLHKGVHQNVDYNFFNLSVNINNHFLRKININKELWKSTINNSKYQKKILLINKQGSFCVLSKLKTIGIERISLNITSLSILFSSNRHHVQSTTYNAKNLVNKSTGILAF